MTNRQKAQAAREAFQRANDYMTVLTKGFAGRFEQVDHEEEAAALLALMNEILPGAIAEAEKASEAYEPYRRLRFRSPEKKVA